MSEPARPVPALLRLLLVAAVAGAASFGLTRLLSPGPESTAGNELTWLTQEFQLTPQQAQRIQALHAAYRPICAQHCAAILDTKAELATAETPAAKGQIEQRLSALKATCHDSTQAHLEAVAAAMSPEQGQRYLAMISPRLSAHQHTEPLGLR